MKNHLIALVCMLLSAGSYAQTKEFASSLKLSDYKPRSVFKLQEDGITQAAYPVTDMHSHAYVETVEGIQQWLKDMDANNVERVVVQTKAYGEEFDRLYDLYKGVSDRFILWCGLDMSSWGTPDFPEAAIRELERCWRKGAAGVGELIDKGLGERASCKVAEPGLHFNDDLFVPIFSKCAELGMPVSCHVSDPVWMYEELDEHNDGYMNAAHWKIDTAIPGTLTQNELVATMEEACAKNPNTTFIACHLLNISHDYESLARVLDRHPNLYIDNSARHLETAATPRATKAFYEKYADRIVFGTDNNPSSSLYALEWRILESDDEHFYHGGMSYHWPLHGLELSGEVLEKIYNLNPAKILGPAGESKCLDVVMLDGEKWWGSVTDLGNIMPFDQDTHVRFNHQTQNFNNQTTPLLVSNKGRYIWSDSPFAAVIKDGVISLKAARGVIELVEAGATLKDAFCAASKDHFPASGAVPPELFFSVPQYNTWIELVYNQNQADIMKYAHGIVDNGFPTGILMIDDNWQKYYGNFEFRPDRFPDPKGMVDELHAMGFKIMLWISPFVSPDSQEFRYLREKGYLVKKADGSGPAILDWWNGLSACYDLSNPEAFEYFTNILIGMQQEYGIDGFKLDAGDPERYQARDIMPFDGKSFDTEQTELWAKLGLQFPYNEFRACWKMGGQALVQRLGDKEYSWDGVARLVPSMISAGLLGHAFTCPDMIGGGQFGSFIDIDPDEFDQALIVRSCQIHSMMPMMQFSVAPWRILSEENLDICRKYALLHQEMGPYILRYAEHAAKTGEPIVRAMDYAFPGQGFEECNDQYMLGDEILVAPVMDASLFRSVKLPKGKWQDENGKVYKGGKAYVIDVPLDRLPRFTRK